MSRGPSCAVASGGREHNPNAPPLDAEVELIPGRDARLDLRIVPRERAVLAAAVIRALDGPPRAAMRGDP